MDDLIADFVAECREMLEALGGEIVAWEAQPDDRARLDSIFRFVHTVKGNCGFFDFPRLEALSHAAEDALSDCRAGRRTPDQALVSAVLAVIDRIGEMVAIIENGSALPDGDDSDLIDALAPTTEGPALTVAATGLDNAGKIAPTSGPRTIRLSVELLDRVMSGVSDMVLARNELSRRLRETAGDVAVDGAFERLSTIIAEMRDAITRTRMQRIENLFVALPRMVRDLSAELGKQVLIDIDGGDVELDREMIEMIRDPLTHIIRNAVDHGIEKPADRLKSGKREIGLLTVSARQSGNQILIDIVDDGGGIDGDRLVAKAVANGVLTRDEALGLTQAQKLQLIFEAGLSTAQEITAISGRGVGMDVVRSNVEKIGGVVEIDSTVGEGTKLTLRVPLTLTIIPALTVSIGKHHFAISRSSIDEIVRVNGASVVLESIGGAGFATIRGNRVPQVDLHRVLGLDSEVQEEGRSLIVLRPAGADVYALSVDRIHDHEELVVKPAAPAVMSTGLYAGTTLADDGSPILLLDAAGIAQDAGVTLEAQDRAARFAIAPDTVPENHVQMLLFRNRSGARQAIRLGLVDRIEEITASSLCVAAGQIQAQIGDEIIPLAGLDTIDGVEGKLRLFRLSDGDQDIGLAFRDVIDMMAIDKDIIPAKIPGEVGGVAMIGGEAAEVIDIHWLFATYANVSLAARKRPVCRLPLDDTWVQNMLRPIVEAAGYAVIDIEEDGAADLTILSDEREPVVGKAGRVVRLSSSPDQADGSDRIYRYDRAGLLNAIKTVAAGAGR